MAAKPPDEKASQPRRKPDLLLCVGIACLVLATAMIPVYIRQLDTIHEFWRATRAETAAKLSSGSIRPEQVGAALLRSMHETEEANARAARNRAMEIEALLAVTGVLLLVFRVRERKLRRLLQRASSGDEQ